MSAAWRRGLLRAADGPEPPRPLVVKLGGSLLARPGWGREAADLLEALPAPRVIVVGGGPLVDGLRAIDRAEPQPQDLVHRLAIECMGHTARLAAAALGGRLVADPDTDAPTAILDVPRWLADTGRYDALPVGWHVTSDSIAADVAAACGGGLLVVKSVAPPCAELERLAAAGWVDGFLPTAAGRLTWIGWAAPA